MTLKNDKYEKMLVNEKKHYSNLLQEQEKNLDIIQKIEPHVRAFQHAYSVYSQYIKQKCKNIAFEKYILSETKNQNKKTTILSLGCGTADWEIELIEKEPEKFSCEVLEINDELLIKAKDIAKQKNLDFQTRIQDVNEMKLTEKKYDYVIARSSLHHFVKLEHIFSEIDNSLADNGKFIVIGEVIGRNGLKLYEETEKVAQKIFDILPEKFRFNNYTKKTDKIIPNINHAEDSFEAIRSQDILPLLMEKFAPLEHVEIDAFTSLLLDFRYGPNYDLSNPLDKSLIEMIANLDLYYVSNNILKPTALFGIFGKKQIV